MRASLFAWGGWHPIRFARRMLLTVRSILTGK